MQSNLIINLNAPNSQRIKKLCSLYTLSKWKFYHNFYISNTLTVEKSWKYRKICLSFLFKNLVLQEKFTCLVFLRFISISVNACICEYWNMHMFYEYAGVMLVRKRTHVFWSWSYRQLKAPSVWKPNSGPNYVLLTTEISIQRSAFTGYQRNHRWKEL